MRRLLASTFALCAACAMMSTGALLVGAPVVFPADSTASSRIREVVGRREVRLASFAGGAGAVLDTLVARTAAQGDSVVELDRAHALVVLERPMPVDEASVLRTPPDGSERVRLRFEVIAPKRAVRPSEAVEIRASGSATVAGAIWMVSNPGAAGEQLVDLGRRQPYRNELKAWLSALQESFGPPRPRARR